MSTIYGVFNPDVPTQCVYVGQTQTALKRRLSRHIASAKQNRGRAFYDWLRDVLSRGDTPIIRPLLHGVAPEDIDTVELLTIRRYARQGHPLLNKEAA